MSVLQIIWFWGGVGNAKPPGSDAAKKVAVLVKF